MALSPADNPHVEHDNLQRDPLEEVAESFLARMRAGEQPKVADYEEKYPELAADIRELFPALLMMEQGRAEVGKAPLKPAPEAEAPLPQQLGEYRLLRVIGRGGMGVVYEAVQESLGRHVALKVLPFHGLVHPEQLERFRREARAAARLHHTNIVPVFGVGADHGTHYYAMQFIQGQGLDVVLNEVRRLRHATESTAAPDLATSVARGLLSGHFPGAGNPTVIASPSEASPCVAGAVILSPVLEDGAVPSSSGSRISLQGPYHASIARIGLQVAEALEYAHAQGVIHRDIKPSNLLLDTEGRVWITDFGLAKAEDAEELTQTGAIVGTLRYMAPERFQGKADARSDVYALGLTLYELLTLRPAFDEGHHALLVEQITHREPPLPRKFDPRLPRDLETAVLKAMAKDPARRYARAGDLAEDLRRILADRPIRARRASWRERAWRWCRRNPAVATLLSSVAVLLLALAGGASLAAFRLHEEEENTRKQLVKTQDAEQQANGQLCRALMEQARATRRGRDPGRRFLSLDLLAQAARIAREQHLPEDTFLTLRNETIACLALLDVQMKSEWVGFPTGSITVTFDASLERYARFTLGGVDISRVPGTGPRERVHLPPTFMGNSAGQFSPDGLQFVSWGIKGLAVWKHAGDGWVKAHVEIRNKDAPENWLDPVARKDVPGEPADLASCDFSPDGRRLAIGYRNGGIHFLDLASRKRVKQLKAGASCAKVRFHPTRPLLAIATTLRVSIADLETAKLVHTLPGPPSGSLAWSHDGSILATEQDKRIYLWDTATGKELGRLEGPGATLSMAFNRAGNVLGSFCSDGSLRLWDVPTSQLLLTMPSPWPGDLAFSANDRFPILQGNKVQLWQIKPAIGYRTLVRDPILGKGEYGECATSPQQDLLAVGMSDGVGLWDLRDGRALDFRRQDAVFGLVFEPSGSLLVSSPRGIQRLRIETAPERPAAHFGTATPLPIPMGRHQLAASRDGRVLTSAHEEVVLLWRQGVSEHLRLAHELSSVHYVAVSPDGQWLATGRQGNPGEEHPITIWETANGNVVRRLVDSAKFHRVAFSPDGKWLAASSDGPAGEEVWLWQLPAWKPGPRLAGGPAFAFAPDSQLLALESSAGIVRLVSLATGREFACLEAPELRRARHLTFNADGSKLVVNADREFLHVWDLRMLREQLAQRGLDWDLPGDRR